MVMLNTVYIALSLTLRCLFYNLGVLLKGKYQRAASLLTTIDEEISTVSTNLSSKFKERLNVNYVKPFQVFYAL